MGGLRVSGDSSALSSGVFSPGLLSVHVAWLHVVGLIKKLTSPLGNSPAWWLFTASFSDTVVEAGRRKTYSGSFFFLLKRLEDLCHGSCFLTLHMDHIKEQ